LMMRTDKAVEEQKRQPARLAVAAELQLSAVAKLQQVCLRSCGHQVLSSRSSARVCVRLFHNNIVTNPVCHIRAGKGWPCQPRREEETCARFGRSKYTFWKSFPYYRANGCRHDHSSRILATPTGSVGAARRRQPASFLCDTRSLLAIDPRHRRAH